MSSLEIIQAIHEAEDFLNKCVFAQAEAKTWIEKAKEFSVVYSGPLEDLTSEELLEYSEKQRLSEEAIQKAKDCIKEATRFFNLTKKKKIEAQALKEAYSKTRDEQFEAKLKEIMVQHDMSFASLLDPKAKLKSTLG